MFEINAAVLRELMESNKLNIASLAPKAQVQKATVARLIRDGARANLKTIGKIAAVFNVSGEKLILKGG